MRMLNKKVLNAIMALISIVLLPLFTDAQVQVKGSIADSASGSPLNAVTIKLGQLSTTTDSAGQFIFNNVQAGKYKLEITAVNYFAFNLKEITVGSENTFLPVIRLRRKETSLKEVTVIARPELVERSGNRMVLNVSNTVLGTGSTANELLQHFPGLSVSDNGQMRLNGKSGVAVMIDGKLSSLSMTELAEYLKNLPGNTISKIEVLTNPPAKYDAVGSGGIINIITRRAAAKPGVNGSVTTGYNQGVYPNFLNSASLNFRKGKVNLYGSYNYNRLRRSVHYTIERFINGNEPLDFRQEMHFRPVFNNHIAKAGLDFDINRTTSFGFSFDWSSIQRDRSIHDDTYISNQDKIVDSVYFTKTRNIKRLDNTAYNFNLGKRFDTLGHKIELGYALIKYRNSDDRFSNNFYFNPDGSELHRPNSLRNNVPYDIDNNIFRADYTYPIDRKTKLEAGIKGSWTRQSNLLIYDSLRNGVYENIPAKNSRFRYHEDVAAAYVSLAKQMGRYSVNAGLRAEQTRSSSNFMTAGKLVEFDYLDWFPSLAIMRAFGAHRMELGLNRRIGRPSYQDLDPTLIYFTQYYFLQGNIGLRPQYTNIISLNDTYKGKYNVTLRYSRTENPIADIERLDAGTNVLTQTVTNLDVSNNVGLSIGIPINVNKWWSMYNNLLGYYDQVKGTYMGGEYNRHLTGYSFSTNNTFTAPKGYRFELLFKYDSRQMFGLNKLEPIYNLTVGAQKTLLNKKANIKLTIYDVFNNLIYVYKYDYANLNAREERRPDLRQVRVSFTYNFGISTAKGKKYNTESINERIKDR
jgi:hypothetical protein